MHTRAQYARKANETSIYMLYVTVARRGKLGAQTQSKIVLDREEQQKTCPSCPTVRKFVSVEAVKNIPLHAIYITTVRETCLKYNGTDKDGKIV